MRKPAPGSAGASPPSGRPGGPRSRGRLAAAGIFVLLAAGCATPGPLHVYALAPGPDASVRDEGADGTRAEVPAFLEAGDKVTGFAYDPFTDHFFLRLAPGNAIRVVDRPARAIKREFVIAGAPAGGGGDLAVRPRDGHLFLLHPSQPAVIEASRLGKLLRTIQLADTPTGQPAGIAYDAARDQLLVLAADGRQITVHDMAGRRTGELMLRQAVGPGLAFDSERRELYAPLRAIPGQIGVFNETGQFQRRIATTGSFVDVGPRSFVRVF